MDNTFSKAFEIRSFETDIKQKAKISVLFCYFQEIASLHAEHLKVGFDDLEKGNETFWALSRLTVQLSEYPSWKDIITLQTWPKGFNRVFGHRDFYIKKEKEIIGKGASDWIIIDKNTRNLVNPADTVSEIQVNKTEAIAGGTKKISKINEEKAEYVTREARYNDLDMNGHVNSIRYLEWALDCLPTDVLINNQVHEFSVNYQHEVPAKEQVKVFFTETQPLTYCFMGKILSSDKTSFLMELKFNK